MQEDQLLQRNSVAAFATLAGHQMGLFCQ